MAADRIDLDEGDGVGAREGEGPVIRTQNIDSDAAAEIQCQQLRRHPFDIVGVAEIILDDEPVHAFARHDPGLFHGAGEPVAGRIAAEMQHAQNRL